nr:helix-turn-helix domain-containing protein [Rhodococcus sp. WMMA185]
MRSEGGLGDGRSGRSPGRRDEVLAVLRAASGPLSIAEIARLLGVHPNTVRFHLDVLIDAGQVEQLPVAPTGRGRPPFRFRYRSGMDPCGPRNYLLLAEILTEDLAVRRGGRTRAMEAGREWGRGLLGSLAATEVAATDAVDALSELLAELGFAPEQRTANGELRVGLRNCPFLDLVKTRSQIVCSLHLGLMQGAMSALGSPVAVTRLDPFAEPDLCLAHLAPATADAAREVPSDAQEKEDSR